MKNFDPSQWNARKMIDSSLFPEPVDEAALAKAASVFPPVRCVCPTCEGLQVVANEFFGDEKQPCQECEGVGYHLREMEAREEHYYIIHLLQRYQLR
jgi:hypothetical protein